MFIDGEQQAPRIAVIGTGPRCLGALEALAACIGGDGRPLQVDCFDPSPSCGAGPNFDPDEPAICLLNIPMRDIDIRPPDFSTCGSFKNWLSDASDPDVFPTRADLGRYLQTRFAALRATGRLEINQIASTVTGLKHDGELWMLSAAETWHGPYNEVLLSVGQPAVQPDEQLAKWLQHLETSHGVLAQAYPAKRLCEKATHWTGRTVAIRGLALSAFDVLRALTTAQGGEFKQGKYLPSGNEPARILPFSLDGHPPYPKPETEALDGRFDPIPSETKIFSENIKRAAIGSPENARKLLNNALMPAVHRIVTELNCDSDFSAISSWLETEWSTPGAQENADPIETLKSGIAMADGTQPPSVGYVVGQVWRKWQDALRSGYNPAETPHDTAETIVAFDEGLKRFSYGPPISSSRELAALIDAGIVDLSYATDPDFSLTEAGWTLETSNGSIEAEVMIDAVMPSPDLSVLRTPLLVGLMNKDRLSSISDRLAAHTARDGQLIGPEGMRASGLCLLGRLALGSVVAADSLHDCFGEASHRWAQGVVNRISSASAPDIMRPQ